jgi:hypothetical protein
MLRREAVFHSHTVQKYNRLLVKATLVLVSCTWAYFCLCSQVNYKEKRKGLFGYISKVSQL